MHTLVEGTHRGLVSLQGLREGDQWIARKNCHRYGATLRQIESAMLNGRPKSALELPKQQANEEIIDAVDNVQQLPQPSYNKPVRPMDSVPPQQPPNESEEQRTLAKTVSHG
ncbi:hypothetical protein ISCGN_003757 [Ixodes scapularis]